MRKGVGVTPVTHPHTDITVGSDNGAFLNITEGPDTGVLADVARFNNGGLVNKIASTIHMRLTVLPIVHPNE